jgi:hypothetical protein
MNPAVPHVTYACVQLDGVVYGRTFPSKPAITAPITGNLPFGIDAPIPVRAGEQIGSIGAAPTDAAFNGHGTFFHLEAFSTEALLSGDGYTTVDATDTSLVTNRKGLYDLLLAKKLVAEEAAGVILPTDISPPGASVDPARLRSAIVKTKSAWDLDWKVLLAASPTLGFMKTGPRNTMGDNMNLYRWWPTVAGNAGLPASGALLHYHPITLLLQLAQQA